MNDYSVSYKFVQRSLTVRATPDIVRIFHENEEVAHHVRCYDRGQQIEDEAHVKALESYKEAAAKHRSIENKRGLLPPVALNFGTNSPAKDAWTLVYSHELQT